MISSLRSTTPAALYDTSGGVTVLGGPITNNATVVSNGLFTLTLDFGSTVFDGGERWLEIGVVAGGGSPFTTLLPRQQLTSVPYAIKAANAMTVSMGTISDPVFLGTTTNEPLELYVNNERVLRVESTSAGPNLVGGYSGNTVGAGTEGATISGGGRVGDANTIGADSDYSVIGGGNENHIADSAPYSTIAGGRLNDIFFSSSQSTIGGGFANLVSTYATNGTIAGGRDNLIGVRSGGSTVGGGRLNAAMSDSIYCTVAGGHFNLVGTNCAFSTISGGASNNIADNAQHVVVPGGCENEVAAGASYAFAAGRQAKADHLGAFVWADAQAADFHSQRANQFRIRADGGVRFDVNNGHHVEFTRIALPNRVISTSTGAYLSEGGVWTDSSDRAKKEGFRSIDPGAILEQVNRLPISTWNFKTEDPSVCHIGPVAQDFHAAFGVGADDKHIAALDANGVALAAIQGLNEKLERGTRNAEQRMQNAEVRTQQLEWKLERKETEIAELRLQLSELRRIVSNLPK